MSHGPNFDELVGVDAPAEERERLERVHKLLVAAGPPPELSPELAAGPSLFATKRHARYAPARPRLRYLAVAASIALVAFLGGRLSGGESFHAARSVPLRATAAAPRAGATLEIAAESNGNWPMRIQAHDLPKLSGNDEYAVFLVRGGKVVGLCGYLRGGGGDVETYLNAPYRLRGAQWVVTRWNARRPHTLGQVVLRSSTV